VSADVDRVCSALKRIQKMKSPEQELLSLSDLLQPHFLSVLTFFNGQLRLASVTLAEKKQVSVKTPIHFCTAADLRKFSHSH